VGAAPAGDVVRHAPLSAYQVTRAGTAGRRAGFRVMEVLVVVLAVIAVGLAFYAGLRVYTRRQMSQGHKPPDID
jgi:hypothetical protein